MHDCNKFSETPPWSEWCCYSDDTSTLQLAVNGEYGVQVEFCPFCGYQVDKKERDDQ